jgi:hypothetical protein
VEGPDGLDRFGTRRIDHSLKTEEDQARGKILMIDRVARMRFLGESQHAQALRSHAVGLLLEPLLVDRISTSLRINNCVAALKQGFDGSLHPDQASGIPRRLIQGCHVLILGFEWNAVEARMRCLELGAIETDLGSRDQQRAFGGIAHDAPNLVIMG